MKKDRKKLTAGLLLAAAVLAAAGAAFSAFSGDGGIRTEEVRREHIEDWYAEDGVITSGREYRVIAQAGGPVGEVLVSENSRVTKGQKLFAVDDSSYRYEKELAESALAGYEAQLEQSRINQVMTASPQEYLSGVREQLRTAEAQYQAERTVHEGNRVLYESGDISLVEFENSEAAFQAAELAYRTAKERCEESSRYLKELEEEGIDEGTINSRFYDSERKQLEAQIAAQKTAIEQLEDDIARCEGIADCDGIVTELPIEGMTAVSGGETAAVIRSLDGAGAEADVLTAAAPYIKVGTPVRATVKLRGQDEVYTGTVNEVYDYAAKGTSALGLSEYRVHVTAKLDGTDAAEGREGYGIDLKFLLYEADDALTVPVGAVFTADEADYVFAVRDGRAVKTPVEVSYRTGTRAVIGAGLSEGDRVIAQADAEEVYEGGRVR